jgi:uridine kinase
MKEQEVFHIIREKIIGIQQLKLKVVRVGINGVEGTGKTVFCEKFTKYLNENGQRAIQITIDGFHNPKVIRYKQGRNSAIGYYEDAYNEKAFVDYVLISSQKERPFYVAQIHNLETDEQVIPIKKELTNQHILLTDGAYLFKKNYKEHWDIKIYLQTDFTTALKRGIQRDFDLLGGLEATKYKYDNRYHKASKIYIEENRPTEIADIIIDNTDFENLLLLKR